MTLPQQGRAGGKCSRVMVLRPTWQVVLGSRPGPSAACLCACPSRGLAVSQGEDLAPVWTGMLVYVATPRGRMEN